MNNSLLIILLHTMTPTKETIILILVAYGFTEDCAKKAVEAIGLSVEKALDWIYEQPDYVPIKANILNDAV